MFNIHASDLCTLSAVNLLCKFATAAEDDLLCLKNTDITLEDEFKRFISWASDN